jgi:hypothetical protein
MAMCEERQLVEGVDYEVYRNEAVEAYAAYLKDGVTDWKSAFHREVIRSNKALHNLAVRIAEKRLNEKYK